MQDVAAFTSGADLWIVPERKKSRQVQHLDWYLNFQIAKSVQHQPAELPPTLQNILRSCALKNDDFVSSHNTKGSTGSEELEALLILSSKNLPSRWVMVLKGSEDLEAWMSAAIRKWKKMNSPSLRVFLPEGANRMESIKIWKRLSGPESVQLIDEAQHER